MQNFMDTVSGEYRSFDDDVKVVKDADGGYTFFTALNVKLTVPVTLVPISEIPPNGGAPLVESPVYIPAHTIIERLERLGLWDATAALIALSPAVLLKFSTLQLGVLSTDQQARDILTAVGANPDAILKE